MCEDDEQKPAFAPIDLSRNFRLDGTNLQPDLAGMNEFNAGNPVVIQPPSTHVGLKRLAGG
jgi:hypothetical protein